MKRLALALVVFAAPLGAQVVRVDTLLRTVRTSDTLVHNVTVTVHDTVSVPITTQLPTTLPSPTGGVQIVLGPLGETLAYSGALFLGRIVQRADLSWQGYKYTVGSTLMPCVGLPTCTVYPTALAAAVGLNR